MTYNSTYPCQFNKGHYVIILTGTRVGWFLATDPPPNPPHHLPPGQHQHRCPAIREGHRHPPSPLPPRTAGPRVQRAPADGSGAGCEVPPLSLWLCYPEQRGGGGHWTSRQKIMMEELRDYYQHSSTRLFALSYNLCWTVLGTATLELITTDADLYYKA